MFHVQRSVGDPPDVQLRAGRLSPRATDVQKIKKIPFPQLTAESTAQLVRMLERGMTDLRGAKSESVEKYTARWSYLTTLSCRLYFQDLLDQKQFLRWLVDALSSSAAKGTLLVPILVSLLSEFARSRALSLLLIRALTPGCEQASPTCQPFAAFSRGILEVSAGCVSL